MARASPAPPLATALEGTVGRTREEFVNHEPQASDLRIFRVFYQHPKSGLSAYKP